MSVSKLSRPSLKTPRFSGVEFCAQARHLRAPSPRIGSVGSGGPGGLCGALGQLWEALAGLWEALGEVWEGLRLISVEDDKSTQNDA